MVFWFFSYTELEIAVPDIGIVGLHAENLVIESVSVDGEPTEFEFYPHHQHTASEKRWSSVSSASSAADVASSMYVSALERELVPNLLIMCCKPEKSASEQQGLQSLENGLQSSAEQPEPKQVIVIIISDAFSEFSWFICRDYKIQIYLHIYLDGSYQNFHLTEEHKAPASVKNSNKDTMQQSIMKENKIFKSEIVNAKNYKSW